MPKQHKASLLKNIIILGVVFCVVLAPTLKAVINNLNNSKKTCQVTEENQDLKDTSQEKELFSKFLYPIDVVFKTVSLPYIITTYQCVFHTSNLHLKIHTPPPDFLLFLANKLL
ncbi:hypothetical protein QVZ41_02580 [Wenyingzhuangia sp. chi5]|uniref:Uncharacterized protein n=1 Tax=Wenyingzhuangia gilva TaxID=3057677 RepID=A0ABT8VP55_9FLAO|nr:hypothetical protein [Wenyingzhuangia sp. chi5]MDO3693732.1 hypothetical protein [Wenyingzhuangia sp. chi5]